MNFSVVIEKEDKFYIARIPELDIVTQGLSFEEAMANAKEAAELYLEDPDVKKNIVLSSTRPIVTILNVTVA